MRLDAAARKLEEGPAKSGVFARPVPQGDGFAFELLDAKGRTVRTLGPGAGLVAATRFEEQQPTWVVTGTDAAGRRPRRRAARPRAALRDRFAVAAAGTPEPIPLPVDAPAADDADRARIPRHRLAAARDARGRCRRVRPRAVRGRARHPAIR